MQYAWLTDIHLNFIDDIARRKFYQEVVNTVCVLISGDIAEAPCLIDILKEMAECIDKPIYFVLDNHDYYRGQIQEVHHAMAELTKNNDKLFWLPASGHAHSTANICYDNLVVEVGKAEYYRPEIQKIILI